MKAFFVRHALLACAGVLVSSSAAFAQTEVIFSGIAPGPGGTHFEFPHVNLPGAVATEFEFNGAVAQSAPESRILVIVFEWLDATDPTHTLYNQSPDNAFSITPFMTDFVFTGVFTTPDTPAIAAIHFYRGSDFTMTVSGEFRHTSIVPEPALCTLLAAGGLNLLARRRRR